HFPPMKRSYRGAIVRWDVDSGAGAYSHRPAKSGSSAASAFRPFRRAAARGPVFASALPPFFSAISVLRELFLGPVAAGLFLLELHQKVVDEGRGSEPEEVRRQPVGAERLLDDD